MNAAFERAQPRRQDYGPQGCAGQIAVLAALAVALLRLGRRGGRRA